MPDKKPNRNQVEMASRKVNALPPPPPTLLGMPQVPVVSPAVLWYLRATGRDLAYGNPDEALLARRDQLMAQRPARAADARQGLGDAMAEKQFQLQMQAQDNAGTMRTEDALRAQAIRDQIAAVAARARGAMGPEELLKYVGPNAMMGGINGLIRGQR